MVEYSKSDEGEPHSKTRCQRVKGQRLQALAGSFACVPDSRASVKSRMAPPLSGLSEQVRRLCCGCTALFLLKKVVPRKSTLSSFWDERVF
jgi:hypothetical protein